MADTRPEFAFIDWVRRHVARQHPAVAIGIGDDAALIQLPPSGKCLVTTDMLMEGVDFVLPAATPRDIGRKSLAVSLSDIAAMAGRPMAAFVSFAVPKKLGRGFAEDVCAGIDVLAQEFDVAIAGGDTNTWDGPFVVNVTVLGTPTGSGPVCRSGARPGDWILVTGQLGGSLAGKHFSFQPRVHEAIALHEFVELHAMIDISDGLAADLHHILEESRVGAVVRRDAIPISQAAERLGDAAAAVDHALSDGEDFELIFTVSPEGGQRILAAPPVDVPISHIGEITAELTCGLIDSSGRSTPLVPAGWVHSF